MRKILGLVLLVLLVPVSASADCLNLALGQNWTFYLQGSRFSTGAAYDATGSPAYRLYEEETATPILTGSYALLDDANTTGLYSEQIAATAANGFEAGKCYVIYSSATVDSVAAAKIDCACISYRTDTSGYIAASGGAAIDDNPWDAGTRTLTAIDEDDTTLDLNATTIGTVTTATNLTNLPTIPTAWITADGIATDAIGAAEIAASAIANGTEATGFGTAQTGDSYARLGAPAGASVSADVAAVKGDTAAILTDSNLYDTDAEYAVAIWNGLAASYNAASTMGAKLNTAGGAADPLLNAVPGSYVAGTAGYNLGYIDEIKTQTDTLASSTVTVVSPVSATGNVTIIKGDTYSNTNSTAITWTRTGWVDLTGYSALKVSVRTNAGSVTSFDATAPTTGAGSQVVRLELTAAQTALLSSGRYDIQATISSRIHTIMTGTWTVTDDITP